MQLLLIPQRYEFSSKSQQCKASISPAISCCWYHKGTNFQANHNRLLDFLWQGIVVADTTKVRIFKQITTYIVNNSTLSELLLIPQRYEFSSKSQLTTDMQITPVSCCWYHKGTNFQANHNSEGRSLIRLRVVADTTKVRIFKQITTKIIDTIYSNGLLLIPQRYEFSSKSQHQLNVILLLMGCCWYHKGTNFQANHNPGRRPDTLYALLLIPQRYEFSSKSQRY